MCTFYAIQMIIGAKDGTAEVRCVSSSIDPPRVSWRLFGHEKVGPSFRMASPRIGYSWESDSCFAP